MRLILSNCLLLASVLTFAQVDLGYHLKKGQEFKLSIETVQNIEQDIMGQINETEQSIKQGMQMKVLSKDGENYRMSCEIYKIGWGLSSPMLGMEQSYDSENPDPASPFAFMGKMVGQPFEFKMTQSGTVSDITGLEEIIIAMVEGMELDEASKQQTLLQLQDMMGEKSFKGSMDQVLQFFPGKKVSIGDTWINEADLVNYGIVMNNEFTLKELNKEQATVELSSDITSEKTSQSMNGMDVEVEIGGKQSGTFVVDRKSGILIEGTVIQELEGSASTMGMNIPMKIKTTSNYKSE